MFRQHGPSSWVTALQPRLAGAAWFRQHGLSPLAPPPEWSGLWESSWGFGDYHPLPEPFQSTLPRGAFLWPWSCPARAPHWGMLPLAPPALPSAALWGSGPGSGCSAPPPPFWWRGARPPTTAEVLPFVEGATLSISGNCLGLVFGNGLGLLKARVVSSGRVTKTSQSFPRFCLKCDG